MGMKTKEVRVKLSEEAYARMDAIAAKLDSKPGTLGAVWLMEKVVAIESVTANAEAGRSLNQMVAMMQAMEEESEK